MRTPAICAVLISLLSLDAGGAAAEAREYPWCARYDAWAYNCGFATLQQCIATVSGAGGICQPNPRATAGPGAPRRSIKRKRHRH
jgi:hypothetical protein